jgi:hypothetical protein
VPGGPRKTTFSLATRSRVPRGDQVTGQAAGVVEVELLQALAGREPRRSDPAPSLGHGPLLTSLVAATQEPAEVLLRPIRTAATAATSASPTPPRSAQQEPFAIDHRPKFPIHTCVYAERLQPRGQLEPRFRFALQYQSSIHTRGNSQENPVTAQPHSE